jgi:hypothetical protein
MSDFECQECDEEFSSEKDKLQHELEEHEDELSSHDRDQKKNRLNKLQDKEKSEKHERKRKLKLGAIAGIGAIILAVAGFQAMNTLNDIGPEKNASIGVGSTVHWHADYTVRVCGEERILEGGPILAHTHGQTRFHMEGARQSEEQTKLKWIVEELSQGEFNSTHIMGQNTCNGNPAELTIQANGEQIENPEDYIVRDGDRITIVLQEEEA